MENPLVSVICLSYNHARFAEEAIQSVLSQTYSNVELIVVDDASTDNSVQIIEQKIKSHSDIKFLALKKNLGHCKAFNQGYSLAKGKYIIDLAADDVLLPNRIETGVKELEKAGDSYGVHFSDAEWISETGEFLSRHSERFPHNTIPQGDIYKHLISRFFICSPTAMYTRAVMTYLGGYDENLLYEDFDVWIRSSRKFKYLYSPEVLVKKRIVRGSMSSKQFEVMSPQLESTYLVCEKILALNKNNEEKQELRKRILYEIKTCLRLLSLSLAWRYLLLLRKNSRMIY